MKNDATKSWSRSRKTLASDAIKMRTLQNFKSKQANDVALELHCQERNEKKVF